MVIQRFDPKDPFHNISSEAKLGPRSYKFY